MFVGIAVAVGCVLTVLITLMALNQSVREA
jgi:hypothetical protein